MWEGDEVGYRAPHAGAKSIGQRTEELGEAKESMCGHRRLAALSGEQDPRRKACLPVPHLCLLFL
jgi:hypothetical protein